LIVWIGTNGSFAGIPGYIGNGYSADSVIGKTLAFPPSIFAGSIQPLPLRLIRVSSLLSHALHPLLPAESPIGRKLLHDVTVSAIGRRAACPVLIADDDVRPARALFARPPECALRGRGERAPDVILTLTAKA
jgi:hypothetical protein